MKSWQDYVGLHLKRNVVNKQGSVLLPAGTCLTDEHVNHFMKNNVLLSEQFVSVEEEARIEKLSVLEANQKKLMTEASHQVKEIFQFIRMSDRIPFTDIRENIIPAITEVSKAPNLFKLFGELQSKDSYTYSHTIGVGVIATLIGRCLNLEKRELAMLTLGATLHDIGKMKIPQDILKKPGKLTKEEFELMKKHTIYGYELITKTVGTSQRFALIALQHHEREDEQGYPFGLKGDKIDFLSKIVAVADVFHAMSSKRVYHDALPFYDVMQEMQRDIFGKLEPKIVLTFIEKMIGTLVGQNVLLTDGRSGKIMMMNPYNPAQPIVQVKNEVIDLGKNPDINMAKII